MTTSMMDAPPDPAGPQEPTPIRRRRGRPAGSGVQSLDTPPADPTKQVAPDSAPRRTRSTGARAKVTAAQAAKIKTGVAVAIKLVDGGANKLAPDLWRREDAFTNRETAALVDAVWLELETFPKALNWLVKMAERGVHAQVAAICVAVALPRLVSRGIVPPIMGLFSEAILSGNVDIETIMGGMAQSTGASNGFDPSAAVGAGAAYVGGGQSGAGEIHPDSGVAAGPFVHSGFPQ